MKITWFSPLPPASGPAAELTARVLPRLAEEIEVVLMAGQDSWEPGLAKLAEILATDLAEPEWAVLNRSEMTVYHLSADPSAAALWQLSQRHPGLVVLHDERMWPLFADLVRIDPVERERVAAHLEAGYGPRGYADLTACLEGSLSDEAFAERYPLSSLAAHGALSVLVSSSATAERLVALPCPVAHATWPRGFVSAEATEPWIATFMELLAAAGRYRPRAMARLLGQIVTEELSLWSGFPPQDAPGARDGARQTDEHAVPQDVGELAYAGAAPPHPLHRRVVGPVEDAIDELLGQTRTADPEISVAVGVRGGKG